MSIRQTPLRLVCAFLLIGALGAFIYYRFYTTTGILSRVGVHFDDDASTFASPNLNEIRFWFDSPSGRVSGPSIVGDHISVERPYRTTEGRVEFAIQSNVHRSGRVRIQLVSPPLGDAAFHVADTDTRNLNVRYAPQGIYGSP